MVIGSHELAGRRTVIGSVTVSFDENGHAEVADDCGIISPEKKSLVPGFFYVSGEPRVKVLDSGQVVAGDGPLVICMCPPDMAGRRTSCPDGHTLAVFNQQRLAFVPNTCGLDQVPGYRFLKSTELNEAAQQAQEIAATEEPAVVAEAPDAAAKPVSLEYVRSKETEEAARVARAARAEAVKPVVDPRVRVGTQELPLPTPSPRAEGVSATPETEERPLVPLTEEEQAAIQDAAASADQPEQSALLEGGAPTGEFQCTTCPRNDFKNKRALDSHAHSCRKHAQRHAPVIRTEPVVEEPVVAPATEEPAPDKQKAAVDAAVAAMK